MSVTIKTAREIEKMREAGRLLEQVHDELENFIRPGVSTLEIDQLGEKIISTRIGNPGFSFSKIRIRSIRCPLPVRWELSMKFPPCMAAVLRRCTK